MNTILVVDDDPNIRKFLRRVLEQENFEILEACDGEECISLLKDSYPSIVLIDIVMPKKDGISAIKEIKKQNKTAKVIAISGGKTLTPEIYLDEAKLVGADYILSKPIDRHELVSTIKDALT